MNLAILIAILQPNKICSIKKQQTTTPLLKIGTKISYQWYSETIYGKVVPTTDNYWSRFGFQCAEMNLKGSNVIIIIDPNKATIIN